MYLKAKDALDDLGLSPTNRVCYWIIFIGGLATVVEGTIHIANGGEFQFLRHPIAVLACIVCLVVYRKGVRLASEVLEREGHDALMPELSETMDVETMKAFLGRIDWRRPARAWVLFGRNAMKRAIQKEVARSMR